MYEWVDVCLQTLPCHYSIIHHQTVTRYKRNRISLSSSSGRPVKFLNLKYLGNKTFFHTEMATWVNEFIPIFRWSKIMVTRTLLAAARKPWEVLFSCLWWITDKAVGIQNDCSWNDVILMTMRDCGVIYYLPPKSYFCVTNIWNFQCSWRLHFLSLLMLSLPIQKQSC